MIEYLLLAPVITGILCLFTKTRKQVEVVSLTGSIITLLLGLILVVQVYRYDIIISWQNALFADAFSAFIVLIVSIVGFVASIYSTGYMGHELEHRIIDLRKLRIYYALFHVFMFTMLLVGVTNNLGLWIAIEMTTLVSALLMILYSRKSSIEAAWKYMIICTVGITFALFGTILTYYASVNILGETGEALNWTSLLAVADQFDPAIMRLAFIFILIGYGTKAGLAPMHTWLPDAHSEAPTPVSALLSGVLLNCAMYGIIRFNTIASRSTGTEFSSNLLIVFGLLSIGIAVPFILLQEDYKRLLAYSSVEHMGIVALGIGFGGIFGVFGAILHMFNHAMTKSFMFFGAGNVLLKHKTKEIDKVSGTLKSMPFTGPMLIIGGLAITGSPPFSIFISEFTILAAGFSRGYIVSSVLFLLFIIIIFAGFFYHISRMVLGVPKPEIKTGEVSRWMLGAMAVLIVFMFVLGVYIPPYFYEMLMKVVNVVR
ncbi:formate hydrogenlyase subunit 3/multisubunit Na+/H+ antiporter, MnhD subunit [Candidatus Methanoperedens nitroreducens]|uniref:Formate hydrogenlyase subunit 3/multisubunit Na+/H+ antiporter, MnhD subunit n=1 Tax=Candidatus Methanoperedens nitratireducens TaxID=1392998 RepID=A0A062V235_9EURY|nr:hydrogenase 4 subunit F [Candidatus Methanoperedens nitroreducens]KCZ70698.1 formate hydrogenlyase subunit 3/multisubunit Na+/H+ antiporter, MnhD subunit [Candidatus Methanoperedens nitroreducens]MDJ1420552.1 hydrogenase 4 subunit F [Candidatus Methanoperedens sp.]